MNYGTYETPFAATSLWYSKPINPVFDDFEIPAVYRAGAAKTNSNKYYPQFGPGAFSCGVFKVAPTDGPMTFYKVPGKMGIIDKDNDLYVPSITIPKWPANAVGATGSDGHCDIIDEEAKIIHSLWGYKKLPDGTPVLLQYAWAPLDGSGYGTGAVPTIGARAAGVTTCAGMIRKHEVDDGKPMYEHALACSLDPTGLACAPAYCLPATSSDFDPGWNTGKVKQGALIMLLASYDTSRLNRWPAAKKIAETLKVYGARVVDRNTECPINIPVENGSNFSLSPGIAWDTDLFNELENIRSQLRQVVGCDKYVNALGQTYAPAARQNMMSLRGPWIVDGVSTNASLFESTKQRLNLPANNGNWKCGTSGFKNENFKPQAGKFYKLYVESDCKAKFKMTIVGYHETGMKTYSTGFLGNYESMFIQWPRGGWYYADVNKPTTSNSGWLSVRFIEVSETEYNANSPKMV